jgi:hypothetical protein
MNQRNTTRTILGAIIAAALVVSAGSLTALHTFSRIVSIGGHSK